MTATQRVRSRKAYIKGSYLTRFYFVTSMSMCDAKKTNTINARQCQKYLSSQKVQSSKISERFITAAAAEKKDEA